MFQRFLQMTFHAVAFRPLVYLIIGLSIRGRERLPRRGPAIVVANHNSHYDTALLMSIFPIQRLHLVRPVAAADYWLASRFVSWFGRTIMGIIPIDRKARERGDDPLVGARAALDAGDILIIFPEGSRGEPERMAELKKGISYLLESRPDVPVVPVFLRGSGRVLPRGSWLPVPFFVDVVVGEAFGWTGDRASFMERMRSILDEMSKQGRTVEWS